MLVFPFGIISGDHEQPTKKLAADLGIEHYFAETLRATLAWRENKALLIEQLQKEGTPGKLRRKSVCFVGDGINDAIALTAPRVPLGEKSQCLHLVAWGL